MSYSDICETCLFAGPAEAVVTFMTAIPNESGLEPVHPGGVAPVGEIAAVTACGNGDALTAATIARMAIG
jgi:hypothetical protein